MKKLILILLAVITALTLAACANSSAGDNPTDSVKLTVGASPAPHAEILENLKPILAQQGVALEIVIFTDYVLPNLSLQEGEIDANYFQHIPYLENFNAENGTDLIHIANVHFEPMGIYAGKSGDLAHIPEGAEIGVPSDSVNEARALQLLAAQGVITLKEGVGLEATLIDIVDNPKNIRFYEAEAALLPHQLVDLDYAVINGNYAIDAGIQEKLLCAETKDSDVAKQYPNVLAVKNGNQNSEAVKKLAEALNSDACRTYIEETYDGYVVPVF